MTQTQPQPALSDDELIALVRSRLPRDLSPPELDELRRRMRRSAELREALLAEVALEQGLATVLAPPTERLAEVVQEIHRQAMQRRWRRRRWWVTAAVLCLSGLTVGAGLTAAWRNGWRWDMPGGPAGGAGAGPGNAAVDSGDTGPDADGERAGAGGTPGDGRPPLPPDAGGTTDDAVLPIIETADSLLEAPTTADEATIEALLFDRDVPPDRRASRAMQATRLIKPVLNTPYKTETAGLRLNGPALVSFGPAENRMVRLELAQLEHLRLDLWSGLDGVRVERLSGGELRAIILRRDKAMNDPEVVDLSKPIDPRFLTRPNLIRVDRRIDFRWDQPRPGDPVPPGDLAVRWTGVLLTKRHGDYKLFTTSDDGVRLWLDDRLLIDNWQDQAATERAAEVKLAYGAHTLLLEHYQGQGPGSIRLEWEGPDVPRQVIGPEALRVSNQKQAAAGLSGSYWWTGGPRQGAGVAGQADGISRPTRRTSWSGDGRRWRMLGADVLDVRYQGGWVVIAQGDVPLLWAPLPAPPSQTILDAHAVVTDARLLPARPIALPPRDPPDREILASERAAMLEWSGSDDSLAGTRRLSDGSLELVGSAGGGERFVGIPAPGGPGTSVTLRLTSLTAGAGVAVTHPFEKDRRIGGRTLTRNGRLAWIGRSLTGTAADRAAEAAESLGLTTGPRDEAWLRASWSATDVRWFWSADGRSWVPLGSEPIGEGPWASTLWVGVSVADQQPDARVRVAGVWVARADELERSADAALVAKAPPLKGLSGASGNEYLAAIDAQRPEGVSPHVWRLAAAVAELQRPLPTAARRRAERLAVHSAIARASEGGDPEHLAALRRIIAQMDRRLRLGEEWASGDWVLGVIDDAARACVLHAQDQELDGLLAAWMGLSRQWADRPESRLPEWTMRRALYRLFFASDWPRLRRESDRAGFLAEEPDARRRGGPGPTAFARLTQWFGIIARQNLPRGDAALAGAVPEEWVHPLMVESDRETLNTLSELVASVDAGAIDHAAQILASSTLPLGLAPTGPDSRVFRSTSVLVKSMLRERRDLARAMKERFDPVARVRLQQALAHGDDRALRTLSIQFHGTDAAAQALRRLADRDLALGQFFSAINRYTELLDDYAVDDPDQVRARLRLAAALAGETVPPPTGKPLVMSGGTWSPQEQDQVIADILDSRRFLDPQLRGHQHQADLPGPGPDQPLRLVFLADIDPKSIEPFRPPLDRPAVGLDGDRAVFSHRGFVAGLQLDAREGWSLLGDIRSQALADLPPGRPLILGDRVLLHLPRGQTAHVRAVRLDNGKPLWSQSSAELFVADPVVAGPWVYLLAARRERGDRMTIALQRLAPSSGQVVASSPLVEVRADTSLIRAGSPVITGDGLLLIASNALISVSFQGEVRWIHRLTFIGPEVDRSAPISPILLAGDKAIVWAAGAPELTAVDIRSGAAAWTHRDPDIEGLIGLADGRVIAATSDSLLALDPQTGIPLWRRPRPANTRAIIPARGASLLAVVLAADSRHGDPSPPRRVEWYSLADGSLLRSLDLGDSDLLGARDLWTDGKRVIGFSNLDSRSGRCKVWMLTP